MEMKGIDGIINLLLIALLVRGHVLLEGNPGLGKTALIRSLCAAMDLPKLDVGRIQFTPDLMPSDITGTKMPTESGQLKFLPGPIFCRLLLADEINRATPKTQAAMLEAMAEFQVTVLGQQYPLAEAILVRDGTELGKMTETYVRPPFLVMATQNPIEQEGTYELPEAQLDRFLFKAQMPFPSRATLAEILQKEAGPAKSFSQSSTETAVSLDATLARIHRLGRDLRNARPSADVETHILNIVMASVGQFDEVEGLAPAAMAELQAFHQDNIDYELGPRAATSLTLATLGWAAVAETKPTELSQLPANSVIALAKIAVPVLRHRMKFKARYDETDDPANRHDAKVRQFVALCAPSQQGYAAQFATAITKAAELERI
jgi:MoxR-like ATPase